MSADVTTILPIVPPPLVDDLSLFQQAEQLGTMLEAIGWQVTTAESCTGGWLGQTITAVPGCSAWFDQGLITYANTAKQRLLGVPREFLEGPQAPGAVSEQTVLAMARGALRSASANIAVATSGLAGPGGDGERKPVGMVWIGWAWQQGSSQAMDVVAQAQRYQLDGTRDMVRRQTVALALRGLIAVVDAFGNTG